MSERTTTTIEFPSPSETFGDALGQVLREGARRMLCQAIEAEVEEWMGERSHLRDDDGRQAVVRNGHLPERTITTGVGPIEVRQPRVRDRRPAGEREKFTPSVLPPYLRRTKAIEELIPWLYLKGVSTGDFADALQALVGPGAKGLSANTVTRLKQAWEAEHDEWSNRDLSGREYVYVWADGVHFNIRLEEDRQCILVLLGATADGRKELIAIADGHRESELSWRELLLDCKARGMSVDPRLAIGDGALGFWKAKQAIHDVWQAETREAAEKAFDLFVETYEPKYPRAVACLVKDRTELLTFYDFPAEH